MAMPYPEGEVFFARSVLRNRDSAGYQADNPEHLYSHFMLEYIWNVEADHGSKNANSWTGHYHHRSPYAIVMGSGWNTHYGNWEQLPFSYGPRETDIRICCEHNLCTSGNLFKNHENGDAVEAWFMTMSMPTKEERWVWIDMLAGIRAIYIPVGFSASKDHPNLNMWLQVSFTQNREVNIWRGGSTFMGHETSITNGLGVRREHTIGFDITGLTEFLSCPRQFRKVNPYEVKFIKLVHRDNIRTVPVRHSYNDAYDFSWLTIAQAHSGLDIQWGKGEKGSWRWPFLSMAFSLGWTAVVNPDRFMYELSLWAPFVKIPELFEDGLEEEKKQKVSGEVRSYFQLAHEVLRVDEAKYDKEADANEEPGEVLVMCLLKRAH
ncbi:hypothetical protein FCOIX_9952 [Fusarium coicis]|nr:hypothetical protein FCOIX_9952 [Fusarium coicis]